MLFRNVGLAALMCMMTIVSTTVQGAGSLQAERLRCEYRVDPLGIDTAAPRLSWIVTSTQRNQRQTAYRVLVAETRGSLVADRGVLWDSGKVAGDDTTCIPYGGKPLESLRVYYWKVRVWDADGVASDWTVPAMWQMGLLSQDEWKAEWVGMNNRPINRYLQNGSEPDQLKQCAWVWHPDKGDPAQAVPAQKVFFRRSFAVESGRTIAAAKLYIAADNRAQVFVNGSVVRGNVGFPQAADLDIKDALRPGTNTLAVMVNNEGSGPNPAGLIGTAVITFGDSTQLEIPIDASWMCSDQAEQGWQQQTFDDSKWAKAYVFAKNGDKPWGPITLSTLTLRSPIYLRRAFTVGKSVQRATAMVSAFGLGEVFLNGKPVGEDYFVPGWTDYTRRIYYAQYDVTALMRRGENVLGGVLADGWFSGYVGYGRKRDHYGQDARLAVQLNLEFADGSTEQIVSGGDWKTTTGPLLDADFLMGETYDARRELTGWDEPGFDDSAWQAVATGTSLSPQVQAYPGDHVKVFQEIEPVSIAESVKGAYVFDMGTNLAGVVRLKVRGKAGDTVVLRFAERLNPDGTIYTTNLRAARATDTYVCKGDGLEVWQPHFTFHGFQYVEVTGYPGVPGKDAVTAVELTSATPQAGAFSCSDAVINQLYHNICQTQRSNFIDIPTDCPQRDERLGWTGDAQVYVNTACYNNDVQAFFTKWLVDLFDAQREDGQLPMVAPLKVAGADGGPAWADAGVICPWTIYKMYGDRQLLASHYEGMKKFIAFCRNRSTDQLLPPEQFHCFGDWLNINDDTPKDVIYTSYFAYSTFLTARAAEALGKTAEAAEYNALFERIKAAFNKAYVAEDGKIKGDSQTAYVLALAHGLVDGPRRQQAADYLIRRIRENNWHLSTGFVGTKDLMLVLSQIGRNDVAYRLLHNDTFPSWGFSIKHGATSIWERWNGWTPEQGFGDPGMNSFAHYSFGAVGQWMFENIAGIRTDGPAFKRIVLRPTPGGELTWAKVQYESIQGPIVSNWSRKDGQLDWDVQIPANTTATVYVPAADAAAVRESGKQLSQLVNIKVLGEREGYVVLNVGSGAYRFRSPMP